MAEGSVVRYTGVAFPVTCCQLHRPVYTIALLLKFGWSHWHSAVSLLSFRTTDLWPAVTPVCVIKTLRRNSWRSSSQYVWSFGGVFCTLPHTTSICAYHYLCCISLLYSPRISRVQKQKAIGMSSHLIVSCHSCLYKQTYKVMKVITLIHWAKRKNSHQNDCPGSSQCLRCNSYKNRSARVGRKFHRVEVIWVKNRHPSSSVFFLYFLFIFRALLGTSKISFFSCLIGLCAPTQTTICHFYNKPKMCLVYM